MEEHDRGLPAPAWPARTAHFLCFANGETDFQEEEGGLPWDMWEFEAKSGREVACTSSSARKQGKKGARAASQEDRLLVMVKRVKGLFGDKRR